MMKKAEVRIDSDGVARCPKCGSPLSGIEYPGTHPEHYDGISEYYCETCRTRIGRWTMRYLHGAECEPRYGKTKQEIEKDRA